MNLLTSSIRNRVKPEGMTMCLIISALPPPTPTPYTPTLSETEDQHKERHAPIPAGTTSSRLRIPTTDGAIFLEHHEILDLKAEGSYTRVRGERGVEHLVSMYLHELEEKLPIAEFFRCHHSHLVNLSKVKKLISHDGHRVLLTSGDPIDVSRRKWAALVAAMERI